MLAVLASLPALAAAHGLPGGAQDGAQQAALLFLTVLLLILAARRLRLGCRMGTAAAGGPGRAQLLLYNLLLHHRTVCRAPAAGAAPATLDGARRLHMMVWGAGRERQCSQAKD